VHHIYILDRSGSMGGHISRRSRFEGVYPNVAVVTSPTGPVSAQAFVNVEVRQPQVLGVETEAPAPAPEKVRVLGFETLPNTSGDWNYLGMIAAFLVLSLGVVYGRKAFKA
jgi:LPXTG-motif cell wall-anchored protein